MTANEKIADGIQAHSIDLERFSVDLQNRVLPILNRVERQLVAEIAEIDPTGGRTDDSRKARKEALLKQTRGTIATGYNAIKKTVGDDLQDIAKLSDTAGRKIVNDAIGVEIMTVAIAPEQLRALADGTMIQGAVVKEHWDRQETALRQKFVDKVQDGFIRGESSTEIVNRVRGTKARNYDDGIMKTTKAAASALVHTSVQSVANSARLEVFKAQSDILKGVQHLSALDNRTTVQCRARSMLIWDLDGNPLGHSVPFNAPPIHWNCRSTLIPVLKPWSEVSDEITEAVKEKQPNRRPKKEVVEEIESSQESTPSPVDSAETTEAVNKKQTKPRPKKEVDVELEGIQASMTGPVSKDLDYEAWLKTQPLAMQLEVLGPAKHKLWQDGKLTFRDLVDQRGNPLTLAEIIAKVESGQTTTARGETMRRAKEAAATVNDLDRAAAAAEKDVRTQVNRSVKAGHVTPDESDALKEYRETRIDGQEPPAEAVEAFDKRPEWMQDRINAAIAAKREALRAKEQAGPAAEYAKRKAVAESAQRLKSTLHEPESVAEWVPGQITDATLHGVPFAPWRPADGYNWMTAKGRTKIPGEAALPIIFGATAGAIAAMLEDDGRVWMYQPVTAEGVTNALPFGTLESGMDAQAIALREAWEATGLQAEIVSILGDYRKPNSVMRYYIARRIGGAPWLMGHEAQSVKLVPVDQLAAITDDETDKAAALDLAAVYRKAVLAGNGSLIAGLRAIMEAADDFQTAAAKRRTAMLKEWVARTAKRQAPSAAAAAVYASLTADEQAAYAALAKEKR